MLYKTSPFNWDVTSTSRDTVVEKLLKSYKRNITLKREFQTFVTFCLLVSFLSKELLVYSKPLPKWNPNKQTKNNELLRQTQKIKPI